MTRSIPILYGSNCECCACCACLNACPKNAITMKEDEYGFLYPYIDEKLCVRCGKCELVCAFKNTEIEREPLDTYAAVTKDEDLLKQSASGGIFAVLARKIIENGGVVFGAELQDDFSVKHVFVDKIDNLIKLQGSKYTYSYVGNAYEIVKEYLLMNKEVLFSGTPCQVAGLYGYLGKNYEKLLTVDIVCHGVPSNKMLQEYIYILAQRYKGEVSRFKFRDKDLGWGINGSLFVANKKVKIWNSTSSYLYFFRKGWIYRDSCYKCKYASNHRPGDITLGDYWGIEKQHPEIFENGKWNEKNGISVVIVNSEKGKNYINDIDNMINIECSSFEQASEKNTQLREPSKEGKRESILLAYKEGGWYAVEKIFRKIIGYKYYSSVIKSMIPNKLKRVFKSKG